MSSTFHLQPSPCLHHWQPPLGIVPAQTATTHIGFHHHLLRQVHAPSSAKRRESSDSHLSGTADTAATSQPIFRRRIFHLVCWVRRDLPDWLNSAFRNQNRCLHKDKRVARFGRKLEVWASVLLIYGCYQGRKIAHPHGAFQQVPFFGSQCSSSYHLPQRRRIL